MSENSFSKGHSDRQIEDVADGVVFTIHSTARAVTAEQDNKSSFDLA